MDVRRKIQLASLIVIVNAAIALFSPLSSPPAQADPICIPTQAFCNDVPCNQDGPYKQVCKVVLNVTCPCSVCEGLCVDVGTCPGANPQGWVTCRIAGPGSPCP